MKYSQTFTRPPESGPKSDIGTFVILDYLIFVRRKFRIFMENHAQTRCINNIRLEMSL